MALQKNKRLHKIEMYADENGVLQRIQVVQMWYMKDTITDEIDKDIGERTYAKEFEIGDAFPPDVKTAILDRFN